MKDFSIAMALVDYIPVIFFAVSAVILMRSLYNKMSKGAFALFAAGTIDIICAGALKATYKLLYAAAVCDFEPLNAMFFPVQSIGFLLAGIGILAMICHKQGKNAVYAAVPPVFSGTFVFVALMVAGLGIMDAVLCILSVKLKKPALIALFSLSFICSLCMGYLSSQDFAQASMNWIAEGVNVVGQGTLLIGTLLLRKHGLDKLKLSDGE
ncbi:MAG: hypothetical protein IJF27_03685 [Oscillospiraceae bacterium]|nr:hypothetical protein [Oscillospiraceae bacterium]MBQ9937913.1 hypothetical protein [Oscillospiraceae bacterium]